MKYSFPLTIRNCIGEKVIFQEVRQEPDGDKLIIENFVTPGSGPIMHTHLLQDEALTVVKGKIGYQLLGQEEQFAGEGETIVFKRGIPHRFRNAGQEVLHCKGWVKPAHNFVFYLSSVFAAQNKSGKAQPEKFDGAFLIKRYASEFELHGIPLFVKKVIIPATYYLGRLLGKYKHFKQAPVAVKE